MYEVSFIFSGTGFVTGKHKITNNDIYKHVKSNYLEGFSEDRIIESENYQKYKEQNPATNPFDYMVCEKMGFKYRYHVVPFPPVLQQYKKAKNSLELCVEAIEIALKESKLSGNDIDAWFVGTATATQKAPGIAEFAKAYFCDIDNQSPTFSLTSACVGFNVNLECAIDFFKENPNAKHIIVAHSEVMSKLLLEENDFVPFSTFGDAAAAIVLSRITTKEKVGVINIINGEDTQMLDFLGADKKGHLYMNPRMVKYRAVPNIANTAKKLLELSNWKKEDISYFIPHQTGDAIVLEAAKSLEIDKAKLFQEVQKTYGNLSGASVPACFCILKKSKKLVPNAKILTSVTGLGGEFGGFTYIVPKNKTKFNTKPELLNKTIVITGATGGLGSEIAKSAAKKGANLILHYNSNENKINELRKYLSEKYNTKTTIIKADLSNEKDVNNFVSEIEKNSQKINYLINTHAITGSLGKATKITTKEFENVLNSNYLSTKQLCNKLKEHVSDCVLITGSVGEDAQFAGSSAYVASKRALRAFAIKFANEIYESNRTRCVYYIPGVIDSGMVDKLDKSQQLASMQLVRQQNIIKVADIADRVLKSVYRLKVSNVRMGYEANLKVIKDGYLK